MTTYDYDLFTIGAGSGGVRASRMAATYGARVAIAEEHRVGGTCVIRGCVPKKLLVYASHFADDFEDAAAYGWSIDKARFSWPTLIANKDKEIDRLNGVYLRGLKESGVDLFESRAVLEDAHTVRLEKDGRRVRARHILIATGAWPFVPEDIDSDGVAITSNEAFHLEDLPKRIVVVGGGYIAVEFAGIFQGLGAETTLLYRGPEILRGFDGSLRVGLHREMVEKGIDVRVGTNPAAVRRMGTGCEVVLEDGGRVEADTVMFATGRRPNTVGLGLETAGVALGRKGEVVVDRFSQTSVATIYAIGDVTDRLNLTPVAIREGMAFAASVFNGVPTAVDHAFVPTAVFSQPQLGMVGLSEEEACLRYGAVDIYETTFRGMKHTLTGRNEKTLMKIVVDHETDRVLGVHVMDGGAGELIQAIGIPVVMGVTKAQFDATVAVHPTSAEELVTMREVSRVGGLGEGRLVGAM